MTAAVVVATLQQLLFGFAFATPLVGGFYLYDQRRARRAAVDRRRVRPPARSTTPVPLDRDWPTRWINDRTWDPR